MLLYLRNQRREGRLVESGDGSFLGRQQLAVDEGGISGVGGHERLVAGLARIHLEQCTENFTAA